MAKKHTASKANITQCSTRSNRKDFVTS